MLRIETQNKIPLEMIKIEFIKHNESKINQEKLFFSNYFQFSEQYSLKDQKTFNLKPSTLNNSKSMSFSLNHKRNQLDNSFCVYENVKSKSFQFLLNENTFKNFILYNNSLAIQKKFKNKMNLNQVLTN